MTTETRTFRMLHLPEGQNWSCHNSGVCCTTFTKIPVDKAGAERLRAIDMERLPHARSFVACGAEAVVADSDGKGPPSLKLRPDNRCVFRDDDHLCEIHRVLGPGIKPQACSDFPYRYRETPGGVFVGLSFVCPSVRGNLGAPVSEQTEAVEQNLRSATSRAEILPEIRLTRRLVLSWEQYLVVEGVMLEILDRHSVPLETRLIALNAWVNFLDTYWQAIHGTFPAETDENRFADRELEDFAATARNTGYRDIFRVASKQAASPLNQRVFLGMVSSLGNALWHRSGRVQMVGGVLAQYLRHATGVGGVRLNPLAKRVSHRALRAVRFPAEGAGAEVVHRYLRHCIFRKDLVDRFPVWKALNLLLLNAALIRWYAAGVAWQEGRDGPLDADFSEAIRHVEQTYGCHSRFYQFFAEQPRMDDLVESFLIRKNYPFIVLGNR